MLNWDFITNRARSEGVTSFLILKEALHLLILDYLFREGAFSSLVFQGGTALRIVYQGVRYSEDLDFVLTRKDPSFLKTLSKMLEGLPSYLDKFLPFAKTIVLRTQKETEAFVRFYLVVEIENLNTKDRTNIDVMDVPSYENETVIVRKEDFPVSPAIRVETPREILGDKFCAFGSREYVKGRDLWDIHYLLDTMKVPFDAETKEWVRKKVADYGSNSSEFKKGFKKNFMTLEQKGSAILKAEMERFLPQAYQEVFKEKYPEILEKVRKALGEFYAEMV